MSLRIRTLTYCFLSHILFLALACPLAGQKVLPDTIQIRVSPDSLLVLPNTCISHVSDLRNEHPDFLGLTHTRAYLVIKVDREVHAPDSLANEIVRFIPSSCPEGKTYQLSIEKFEILDKQGRMSSHYLLQADIGVLERRGDSLVQIGTLFYDYPYYPRSRKETYTRSVQELYHAWHTDFKLDLMSLQTIRRGAGTELTPNFITDPDVQSLYLNAKAGALVGLNWYGFQGELYFSRPETEVQGHYQSGLIRYIHRPDYESFAIGRKTNHRYWRLNENWTFDIDANFLVGFCKWQDHAETDPTLYQLFDLELSSIQSMVYYPLNRKSFSFRMGLIENASYIIGNVPTLEIGLYLEAGYKF